MKKIEDLKPADYNPRKIGDKQLAMLKKSMAEFGDLSGIVVNVRTGNMIGGHQRIKNFDPKWIIKSQPANDGTGTVALGHVATDQGRWSYREVDWPEEKEKAANLAANKHGGEWDMAKLNVVLQDLKDVNFDIELTGFDLGESKIFDDENASKTDIGEMKYQIVIDCDDEAQQIELIEEFDERGIACRPLIL